MRIEVDDLTRPQVLALLNEHLSNMFELSPPEKVFALDITKLRAPEITFWTVWEDDVLLGCGALKSFGFTYCGAFGSYRDDPNSVFMSLRLHSAAVLADQKGTVI